MFAKHIIVSYDNTHGHTWYMHRFEKSDAATLFNELLQMYHVHNRHRIQYLVGKGVLVLVDSC